jgi:hypothetical protein
MIREFGVGIMLAVGRRSKSGLLHPAFNLLNVKSNDERKIADFHAVAHAVFTYPQVAAVVVKESDAIEAGLKILAGRAIYQDMAMVVAIPGSDGPEYSTTLIFLFGIRI